MTWPHTCAEFTSNGEDHTNPCSADPLGRGRARSQFAPPSNFTAQSQCPTDLTQDPPHRGLLASQLCMVFTQFTLHSDSSLQHAVCGACTLSIAQTSRATREHPTCSRVVLRRERLGTSGHCCLSELNQGAQERLQTHKRTQVMNTRHT